MIENFPYSNEQIAEGFGVTQEAIRTHKSRHKTELSRNVDYVTDSHTNYKVFWSKSGVIKLADWIGTKEAKLFISQWIEKTIEKPFKEISTDTQLTPAQPTADFNSLSDSQLLGMMEMMLIGMKRQADKNQEFEDRLAKVESQKTLLNVIQVKTAKDFKTLKQEKKNEIGVEINELVRRIYIDRYYSQDEWNHKTPKEKAEIYKHSHRESRNDYYRDNNHETYVGAKKATIDSKVKFLNWLKKVEV